MWIIQWKCIIRQCACPVTSPNLCRSELFCQVGPVLLRLPRSKEHAWMRRAQAHRLHSGCTRLEMCPCDLDENLVAQWHSFSTTHFGTKFKIPRARACLSIGKCLSWGVWNRLMSRGIVSMTLLAFYAWKMFLYSLRSFQCKGCRLLSNCEKMTKCQWWTKYTH